MATKKKSKESGKRAKKRTAKKSGKKKATTSKKTRDEKKPKRLSALDAAAKVLAKAGKPMRSRELITVMAKQGLWSSPKGKTPHATLYSAILREITTKGKKARFTKVDRGRFGFNKQAVA